MPNVSIPLVSFTGGEWSNRLFGRIDIQKYNTACEILKNMVVYPHGGATRRMGLEYIGDAKTTNIRLVPFEYNREQAYVLEFGENYIRFFRDGAQIAPLGVPLEIATTYTAAQVQQISYTQSADTLYIVHPNHPPKKLERTGPDVFSLSNIAFTGQPPEWTSTANNYPQAVSFFQSRLVFGGIPTKPQTLWFSKSFAFDNLTIGAAANDGVAVTLSSNQVNAIMWLVAGKKLLVGTTGGEWTVSGGDAALTPSNVQADRESNFGSKESRVQLIGTSAIYASRDGKKLREMTYSFEADGFVSPELSLLSEHLTRPGIKEFDFAQNPDGVLWIVLNNGDFCGLTYMKDQDVKAWHRHSTDGYVKSVCTVEGSLGSEVWFAVERNGGIRIEKMADQFNGDSANDIACAYLDSFLSYDGAPVSTLSGLDHLEGKLVHVLGDGVWQTPKTAVGGSITLDTPASKIIVGLPYEWEISPLSLEGGSPLGVAQGKIRRIKSLILKVERSSGIKYKTKRDSNAIDIPGRAFGDNFDEAVDLYSGIVKVQLPSSWDRDAQFSLLGSSPFPVTILMIIPDVTVNE